MYTDNGVVCKNLPEVQLRRYATQTCEKVSFTVQFYSSSFSRHRDGADFSVILSAKIERKRHGGPQ